MADQASFTMVCDGCVEIAVAVAAYYYLVLPLGSGTKSYDMWIDS
jgi:hypothetical protein